MLHVKFEKKENPLISIIIPIYNVSCYLDDCLESVSAQTFDNFECILVDDGSTDGSGIICDRYAEKDFRFKVIHQTNQGAHAARLAGYRHSKGKFIGFVDGDDWIEPDMYENLIAAMHDGIDISMVCFVQECQGIPLMEIREKWGKTVLDASNALAHSLTRRAFGWELWCKLFRVELFDESVFPIELSVGDDLVTSCLLFQRAKKVVYMPTNSYHYRLHPQSMTHTDKPQTALKLLESIRVALNSHKKYDISVYNYLLYWYSYLIVRKILSSYSEEESIPVYIYDKLFSELKWALTNISDEWLNKREKLFAEIILSNKADKVFSKIGMRNKEKCCFFAKGNEVYIYGAGKMGKKLRKYINEMGIVIKGFIVSEKKDDIKEIDGVRLFGLDELQSLLPYIYIFLGVSAYYLEEIKENLVKRGARHFYWPPILKYGQMDYFGLEKARDKLISVR